MRSQRKLITGLRRPGYTGLSRDSVVGPVSEKKSPETTLAKASYPHPPSRREGVGGGMRAGPDAPPGAHVHTHAHTRESSVEEILEQAQTLTAKQRQELLDQLSLANQMTRSAGQDRDLDMWATAVHEALTAGVGVGGASEFGRLVVKRLMAPTQNWRPIQNFMEESRLQELKVVERASVYYLLAELLVKHAQVVAHRSGAPLGPKLVGSCAQGIAGLFEQAFPGYLRAGLAKIAARQLVASRA